MRGIRPMQRSIEPEWLDELPVDDPGAKQSRRDLRRINAWMRNAVTMAGLLRGECARNRTGCLVELGAGDGEFLLSVARHLSRHQRAGPVAREAVLVDRQYLLRDETAAHFAQLHWEVHAVQSDVMAYLANGVGPIDTMLANLFLHHFPAAQLQQMFHAASKHVSLFIAIEPKRSRLAWLCACCVRLIGCNRVTQHDAPISVRAGFRESELSQLWPASPNWSLTERRSGLFSHLFVARKNS